MGLGRGLSIAVAAVLLLAAGCRQSDFTRSIEDPQPSAADGGTPETSAIPSEPPDETPVTPEEGELDPTPTKTPDGIPAPIEGVYTDKGVAPPDMEIRGLISFPIRDYDALHQEIRELYDPAGARFRQYLSAEEWISKYAPHQQDVDLVANWVNSTGLKVQRVATNRLLLNFTGTVQQFNDAFGVELHIFSRKSPQGGNDPHDVYGLLEHIDAPKFVMERIHAVVALDLAADTSPLPAEAGTVGPPPPEIEAFTPQQIAAAYGLERLNAQGFRGAGAKLGVAIGASFRLRDVRGFWKHMGIERADPVVVQTMEPPSTRYREGTLDVQWSGAMAPDADLIVYMGPDARNTSMMYTFNEAIARNEIDVLTDSFAHREDSEGRAVHEMYGQSAAMAAALGITVMAASGDSAGVDTPSSSPYVTAVGGTDLYMDGMTVTRETAWALSGSGPSRTFDKPWWQDHLPGIGARRFVADVALNSGQNYHFVFLGYWWGNYGTSFASPVFGGMIATLNGARAQAGKPRLGWLNGILYMDPVVQATFRDITEGATEHYSAHSGWDIPTGWGAPNAEGLLTTMP